MSPGGDSFSLADGRRIWLRMVEIGDEAAIGAFLGRLSLETRTLRFFSAAADMRIAARWAATVDATDHLGLIALVDRRLVLGHAAYVRTGETEAEIAVEVADTVHHLGLGTMLVFQLGRLAEAHGIDRFVADVLPGNREMLAVFHDGFDPSRRSEEGVVKIAFPTSSWRLVRGRFAHATPT